VIRGSGGVTDIGTIEMRRKVLGISKNRLCKLAGVDRGTYQRLAKMPGSGRADTFVKLGKALDALAEAQLANGNG
jgi:transcriptional regulator with XRE-family HTH domain